jgi:hypothetical protein
MHVELTVLQAPFGPQSVELVHPQVPEGRQRGPASSLPHWSFALQGPQSPVAMSQN